MAWAALGGGDDVHVPLTAARIQFGVSGGNIHAEPYLSPFSVATFLEPRVLPGRGPIIPTPVPVQKRRSEVLRLALRWDAVDRLRIFPERLLPRMRRSPVTAIAKSSEFDRLILDRRGPKEKRRGSRKDRRTWPRAGGCVIGC